MSWLGRSPISTALRISETSMPCWLADLMIQFWTYFWRFRQCHLNFMPFASSLHAAVAFSRATLSALDSFAASRSEEHTSELQSPCNLVCRLLLEKKKHNSDLIITYYT